MTPHDPATALGTLGFYPTILKRIGDLLLATVLVVLLLPVMVATWVAVRIVLGKPVLYCDRRAGQAGCPIAIVKFRSMSTASDLSGRPLPDAERLGRFGKFLRSTSLDELPQLLSVLSGEMSLVGPRPLPLAYTVRYSPRQATRLLLRPGLTGWAQIHGRNSLDWPTRLELDADYVERVQDWYAPFLDVWIIVATVFQLVWQTLTGRGIAAPGCTTMPEFFPTGEQP